MEFKNDLSLIRMPSKIKYQLIGTKLPGSNDIYFRAKQKELAEQYAGARLFLIETDMTDRGHWFEDSEDEVANNAFMLTFKGYLYEISLFYYNIVVDLSWTMTYTAIEYACSLKGKRVNVSGIQPIDIATELLRKAENNVTSPTAEENPFCYLKLMAPEFSKVIDYIIEFWNDYGSSAVRKKYNYCKHKGKPKYEELDKLDNSKFFSVYVENGGNIQEMATCSDDVMYKYSLEEAISELKEFDEEKLFPYIENLIKMIEEKLSPSPMTT